MRWLHLAIFAVLYTGCVVAGLEFYFAGEGVSTFWPAVGLTVGVLVWAPYRRWPELLLVVTAAHCITLLPIYFWNGWTFFLVASAVNVIEPAIGALLVKRFVERPTDFSRIDTVLRFVIIAVLASTAMGALIGATVVPRDELHPSYWLDWQVWWFADALGTLLVAPVVLTWLSAWPLNWTKWRVIEVIAVGLAMLVLGHVIFGAAPGGTHTLWTHTYLVIPLLVWGAVRFPLPISTSLVLLFAILLLSYTDQGLGPFIVPSRAADTTIPGAVVFIRDVLSLQLFLTVTAMSVLLLSAAVSERDFELLGRQRAEAATRTSEARLQLLVSQTPAILWTTDRRLAFTSITGAGMIAIGMREDDLIGRTIYEFLGTDDPDFLPVLRHRQALEGKSGEYDLEWKGINLRARIEPLRDADGAIIGTNGAALDVTEHLAMEASLRREAEVQQLLLRELDHRVRNNLSSLLSLIDMSSSNAKSKEALANTMAGRVTAMAVAHSQLSRARFVASSLRPLVEALIPADLKERIRFQGEDVPLSVSQTTAVAMIIHELLTNSRKYGALTGAEGTVRIEAEVEQSSAPPKIARLRWVETDGPPIDAPPSETGAGLAIVEGLIRSDLRGEVDLSFPSNGAVHTIRFPLLGEDTA